MPGLKRAGLPDKRVAVITGAAHGIGAAIAERFAEDGYLTYLIDVDPTGCEDAAERLQQRGLLAVPMTADVSVGTEVDDCIQRILGGANRIDVLVNNAAVTNAARHFLLGDDAWWDRVIANNLGSTYRCSARVVPSMVAVGEGCIINLSSGGATKAHRANAAYDASKGGIEALTRAMALDLAPYGIRVNAVVPGIIENDRLTEKEIRLRAEVVPLGRMGDPREVAALAAYLASDDASYITGQAIAVDGGLLVQQRSASVDLVPPTSFPRMGRLAERPTKKGSTFK